MLLSLPLELLQQILTHCTTPAYLQSTFTCRRLYEIGTTSRHLVLHHLHQTPGLDSYQGFELEHFVTEVLFRVLLQRAEKELYGSEFGARCARFCPEGTKRGRGIDGRASSIDPAGTDVSLVVKGRPLVYLFRVEDGKLLLRERIEPPWDHQAGEIEVLKTAVLDSGGEVYVLYRFGPFIDEGEVDARGPFEAEALRSKTRGDIYLAVHQPGANTTTTGDKLVEVWGFRGRAEYEPTALAVWDSGTFAISWRDMLGREDGVVLYSSPKDTRAEGVEPKYKTRTLMRGCRRGEYDGDDDGTGCDAACDRPPVGDLAFIRDYRQLLYYFKGETMFGVLQDVAMSQSPVELENKCTVRFTESGSLSFALGVPFFGSHNHEPLGRRTYLTFGVATHRSQGWTVACLLKSEAAWPANCSIALNLDDGLQFGDWTVAARLWGFQHSTSTQGSIVAASKQGTRVAVADWKTLYIWALEPEVLADDNANGFYPTCMQSTRTGLIELRPIVLQLQAVCFKLQFMEGENELLAITDRGAMCWDLSPMGSGERTSYPLEDTQQTDVNMH